MSGTILLKGKNMRKLSRDFVRVSLVGCVACFFLAQTAFAQNFGQSARSNWFPNSNPSALSPWLELERASTSQLDSYNQYVRPRLEIEREIQAHQQQLNFQRETQRTIQRQVNEIQGIQMKSGATPTGKKASFQNFMHFYPAKGNRQ